MKGLLITKIRVSIKFPLSSQCSYCYHVYPNDNQLFNVLSFSIYFLYFTIEIIILHSRQWWPLPRFEVIRSFRWHDGVKIMFPNICIDCITWTWMRHFI